MVMGGVIDDLTAVIDDHIDSAKLLLWRRFDLILCTISQQRGKGYLEKHDDYRSGDGPAVARHRKKLHNPSLVFPSLTLDSDQAVHIKEVPGSLHL